MNLNAGQPREMRLDSSGALKFGMYQQTGNVHCPTLPGFAFAAIVIAE